MCNLQYLTETRTNRWKWNDYLPNDLMSLKTSITYFVIGGKVIPSNIFFRSKLIKVHKKIRGMSDLRTWSYFLRSNGISWMKYCNKENMKISAYVAERYVTWRGLLTFCKRNISRVENTFDTFCSQLLWNFVLFKVTCKQ